MDMDDGGKCESVGVTPPPKEPQGPAPESSSGD
jgi:hypothetical protein